MPKSASHTFDLSEILKKSKNRKRIVFVSGNFNIIHPGHLRLLNFASECGDFLVIGVTSGCTELINVPAMLRLEAIRSIGMVHHAFLMELPPEDYIKKLKPHVVVKGKEYENQYNPERDVILSYGGLLLFSSGEVRFSSLDLMNRELHEVNHSSITKPLDYTKRHKFSFSDLVKIINDYKKLSVLVLGDLIVDEYINCEPMGLSQEDPSIVVAPIHSDQFVGGAGIVAAHASNLGAKVKYLCVTGGDAISEFAKSKLEEFKVEATFVIDESRPTTLKQRFRANGKTLLRVSHLRRHDISKELGDRIFHDVARNISDCNLLVFSDFNYGCLPQYLVDRIINVCKDKKIMMVADSQTSSQIGDVARFKFMNLLTPTEHETRVSLQDYSSGLVSAAEALRLKSNAKNILITMASEGLFIYSQENNENKIQTDKLPAMNSSIKDPSGAGDALLISSSMALAVGADIWKAAYIGSVAAACQVSRVGNMPLSFNELLLELDK